MLIGELVKRTGCSRDTIRFYEKLGLIKGSRGRAGTNNYKHYDELMIERLLLIRKAKVLGFTLAEIKELMEMWESNTLSHEEKVELFQDKLELAEQRIAELERVKQYLKNKLKKMAELRSFQGND